MYVVEFECDRPQAFNYIKDAAETWAAYPSNFECRVTDTETRAEVDQKTLESVLGYRKLAPCPLKPRSRVAFMF